jgi:hypothetical protein
MFVYTAKLNKRKALLSVIIAALVLALIIILVSVLRDGNNTAASEIVIKDSKDVVLYLSSMGWETEKEPLEVKEIVIPREFTGVYADYIELQRSQGYTIDQYGGLEATRYTFRVLNYPTNKKDIVADVIVHGTTVIAGDIQSTSINGFMTGLKPGTLNKGGD